MRNSQDFKDEDRLEKFRLNFSTRSIGDIHVAPKVSKTYKVTFCGSGVCYSATVVTGVTLTKLTNHKAERKQ